VSIQGRIYLIMKVIWRGYGILSVLCLGEILLITLSFLAYIRTQFLQDREKPKS
jgi:hypothetical protein